MRRRAGFTLIELLASVAVVALLAGLLAPALAGARTAARSAACASSVRQLPLASDLYAADHRGALPPGAADFLANRDRWHGRRAAATGPFAPEGGALTSYLGDRASAAVRRCPAFAPRLAALEALGAGFERAGGGYGYNNAFLGVRRARGPAGPGPIVTDRAGADRDRVTTPAATLAFADAALAARAEGPIEYSFLEPRFWPDQPGERPDPSMHFRHGPPPSAGGGGRASAAWLDGHVSAERRTFTHSSGYLPTPAADFGLGWTGRADDNSLYDDR